LLAAGVARAHEPGADVVPDTPGWQLGGAAVVVLPAADDRWPTAAWPGVLVTGSAPRDQRRGLRLEHAVVEWAARLDSRFAAQLAVGWHDRDSAHIEAATAQARFRLERGVLDLRLGRDTVRLGAVIDSAGHFDRFGQSPLAKRAVLNDQWIDDGLVMAYRADNADGLRGVEVGLWRGQAFPDGTAAAAVPSVHMHWGWGHVDAHAGAAHFRPQGRGAAAQSAGSTGHVHGSLDCNTSLQQRVCFDGSVDLVGASLQWEPDNSDWSFAIAGLARQERGSLYSTSGGATLRSRVHGLWADVAWRPASRWSVATRLERLVPDNRLEGVGTALLAREAGLAAGGSVERVTAALAYEGLPDVTLSFEGGQERHAGGRVSHVALRASWRNARWLGGSW
jgi:hypothetical protein